MPVDLTFTLKDGRKIRQTAKWSSEEVESMDRQQLLGALRVALDFAASYDAEYRKPLFAAADKQDAMEKRANDKSNAVLPVFGILFGALMCVSGIASLAKGHVFIGVLQLVFGAGIVFFSVQAFKGQKTIKEQLPAQKAEVERLFEAALEPRCSQAGANAYVLWPDEFTNPAAFQFAISAIENHRAQTLGQVIGLWEQEKQNEAVRATLERQVEAQYETAQAAREAARYASAAAGAAAISAHSDIYDRDKK